MSQVGQLQRGQHYLAVVETIAENAVLTQLAVETSVLAESMRLLCLQQG